MKQPSGFLEVKSFKCLLVFIPMSRMMKISLILLLFVLPIVNIKPIYSEDIVIVKENIISPKFTDISVDYVEEQFGDQRLFWTNIPELVQLRATLLAVGNWCYIYMANDTIERFGESSMITKCETLRDEFDSNIYPKAIEIAGSPDGNLGDIDGDPHVTVFFAPYRRYYGDNSVLGYYDDKDDDPYNPYSNLREMVYCDSEMSTEDSKWVIVHEFNHMIWGNYEYDEAHFLLEGLAQYAVDYSGYFSWVTDAIANTYTSFPEISLLYFVREYGLLWDASYGQSYIFMTYLAERFGNDFAKKLVSTPEDGALAIDAVLSDFEYTDITFNDIYLDWITACVLDIPSIEGGIYGFESIDYKIQAQTGIGYTFPIQKNDTTHYYYGFDVKTIYADYDNFTFTIENPYPYALGISIAFKDNYGWNVTQLLNTEESDTISLYIEGEEITEAYVITSLMSPSTPSDFGIVYSLSELVSEDLTYIFTEGNTIGNVEESEYSFLLSILVLPVLCLLYSYKKRR